MLLTVCSKTADPEILKEKYSASFIDELKRQITEEISRAMSVEGLEESTLELQLAFEPGTFMEHTSENVTYRRRLITDKLCQPRDFWVKWTRLDGAVAYTVSDEVSSETVAPAANILQHWGIIAPNLIPIVLICVTTTFLVFAVSGLVTKQLLKKKGGADNG